MNSMCTSKPRSLQRMWIAYLTLFLMNMVKTHNKMHHKLLQWNSSPSADNYYLCMCGCMYVCFLLHTFVNECWWKIFLFHIYVMWLAVLRMPVTINKIFLNFWESFQMSPLLYKDFYDCYYCLRFDLLLFWILIEFYFYILQAFTKFFFVQQLYFGLTYPSLL